MADSIIGTSPARLDNPRKAMGKALYTADYTAPDLLYVVLVRAQTARAELLGVDIPPLPEGCFCFTAKDYAVNLIPSMKNDQPCLAETVIRYEGEPAAVVAAPTLEQAKALAAQVRLNLKPLPPVEDMVAALEPDSPQLFETGNLCSRFHSRKGEPETAFDDCALILEDTYRMPVQCHGFLEPEAAFCYYDEAGILCLISSTQNAFADRTNLSAVLGIPLEAIHSMAPAVGGAFGGKDGNTCQVYAGLVTYKTGKPCKIVFSREENIRYGMKRHDAIVNIRMGFTAEGKMHAFAGKVWMDTGAYALLGPAVLDLGVEHMTGPYNIPHVLLDGWLAYTNHAPASAMRGFGGPQTAMAVECLTNRAAERLGIDPLEIRRINAIHRGDRISMGAVLETSAGFEEAVELFAKSDFYDEMKNRPQPGIGYGIAAGIMSCGMGKDVPDRAFTQLRRLPGGRYEVRIGLVDIGQGSETALAMIAAEALGVPLSAIEMKMGDTRGTLDSGSTAASRSTYVAGNAILAAVKNLRPDTDYAEGFADFPEVPGHDGIHSMFAFLIAGVKVRVDPVTGAVQVLDAYNITEAGRIVHPGMLKGQIFGGMAMATGYTLSEQIRYRDGHAMEGDFASYVMPTALDAPAMENVDVPFYEETGPFGAKGMAEAATVAVPPAVAAALKQLVPGLEIRQLPIDREAVLDALEGGRA